MFQLARYCSCSLGFFRRTGLFQLIQVDDLPWRDGHGVSVCGVLERP